MPVVLKTSQGASLVVASEFINENELQGVIAESPALIGGDGDKPIALVQREVTLPEAGHLDLLCVTAAGLPVAVEVKLARNGESRRDVVAQVVDYVSALTQLTVEELDQAVGGRLENALRQLEAEPGGTPFDDAWQATGVNLRAGVARVILVLDDAPPALERVVRFLAERSSLDVRLVIITKYNDPHQGTLYVPNMLVDGSGQHSLSAPPAQKPMKAELAAVVAEFDAGAALGMKILGRAPYYRLMRPDGWPGGVHYEFIQSSQAIGAELHLEDDKVKFLATRLAPLNGEALPDGSTMVWDPKWMAGRGRLRIPFELDDPPKAVASAMTALIERTRPVVDAALQEHHA
jgi:hypothetical protein